MKKIKKILTNIFVAPIRNREKRHKIRRYILDFHLIDCCYFWRFLFSSRAERAALGMGRRMEYKSGFRMVLLSGAIWKSINKTDPFRCAGKQGKNKEIRKGLAKRKERGIMWLFKV